MNVFTGAKPLFDRRLGRSLALVFLLVALWGCQQDDKIAQLRKENPFTNQPRPDPSSIVIVTCLISPMEVPGQVDITDLAFWKKHRLGPGAPTATNGIVSGFTPEQLANWNDNGLQIAIAPLSQWYEFRDLLTTKGAIESLGKITLFRNAYQPYELPAYWLEQARSVFVSTDQGELRGYTLTEGDCFFQINCSPGNRTSGSDIVYIKIVPVFRSVEAARDLLETPSGYIRQYPRIVFDQLTVSGVLQNGFFICIAAKTQSDKADNLGDLFLTRNTGADNYQLLLTLAPRVQTAAEIKTK